MPDTRYGNTMGIDLHEIEWHDAELLAVAFTYDADGNHIATARVDDGKGILSIRCDNCRAVRTNINCNLARGDSIRHLTISDSGDLIDALYEAWAKVSLHRRDMFQLDIETNTGVSTFTVACDAVSITREPT